MNRTAAVDRLRALSGPLTAMGMRALYLFGSTARDETGPASDLDLFIDYDAERNFSLIELAGLQIFLEEQLHVPVDITTRDSLHPLLRPEIERTAIPSAATVSLQFPDQAMLLALGLALNNKGFTPDLDDIPRLRAGHLRHLNLKHLCWRMYPAGPDIHHRIRLASDNLNRHRPATQRHIAGLLA